MHVTWYDTCFSCVLIGQRRIEDSLVGGPRGRKVWVLLMCPDSGLCPVAGGFARTLLPWLPQRWDERKEGRVRGASAASLLALRSLWLAGPKLVEGICREGGLLYLCF